jgi:D-tyrosyl-tRNA(Tyr) deacylase
MRVILQRVRQGAVTVEGLITGTVQQGYVALVGVTHTDSPAQAELLARKTAHLRVFEDADGKMNRSILEVGGGVLVISQFTLYADTKGGRRPSFIQAAKPDHAKPLVEQYASALQQEGVQQVAHGVFGAMMLVEIHNDGPVTILMDTDDLA